MDPAKKNNMTTAISHLFNIKQSPTIQSEVIEIIVYYGKRKILG